MPTHLRYQGLEWALPDAARGARSVAVRMDTSLGDVGAQWRSGLIWNPAPTWDAALDALHQALGPDAPCIMQEPLRRETHWFHDEEETYASLIWQYGNATWSAHCVGIAPGDRIIVNGTAATWDLGFERLRLALRILRAGRAALHADS